MWKSQVESLGNITKKVGTMQQQTLLLKVTSSWNMGNKLQPTPLITLEEVSQGMKRVIFAALYTSDVDFYELLSQIGAHYDRDLPFSQTMTTKLETRP